MCAPYAEHVEAHGGNVAEERHMGWHRQTVGERGMVETLGHETQSELRVAGVMRSADHAEVEAFLLLVLVGIVEVCKES